MIPLGRVGSDQLTWREEGLKAVTTGGFTPSGTPRTVTATTYTHTHTHTHTHTQTHFQKHRGTETLTEERMHRTHFGYKIEC